MTAIIRKCILCHVSLVLIAVQVNRYNVSPIKDMVRFISLHSFVFNNDHCSLCLYSHTILMYNSSLSFVSSGTSLGCKMVESLPLIHNACSTQTSLHHHSEMCNHPGMFKCFDKNLFLPSPRCC